MALSTTYNSNWIARCCLHTGNGRFTGLVRSSRPDQLDSQSWVKPRIPSPCHGVLITTALTSAYEGTPGTTVMCELTRESHPAPSASCVLKESRSKEDSRFTLIVVAHIFSSSASAPCAGQYRQKEAPDLLILKTIRSMTNPEVPFSGRAAPLYE